MTSTFVQHFFAFFKVAFSFEKQIVYCLAHKNKLKDGFYEALKKFDNLFLFVLGAKNTRNTILSNFVEEKSGLKIFRPILFDFDVDRW